MGMYEKTYGDPVYNKTFYWGEYSMFFVASPDKPNPLELAKNNETRFWNIDLYNQAKKLYCQRYPELGVCHKSKSFCVGTFSTAKELSAKTYHSVGLLQKGNDFNEDPDIFCVVTRRGKIVGVLGYCYHNLPIRKTYNGLNIEDNAHELMRLAIDLKLGCRIEVMPEVLIKKRNVEHEWRNAKKACGYRFKKISMIAEVGKMLYTGMLCFYKDLVETCFDKQAPPLWISTHDCITAFYFSILQVNIFEEQAGEINWDEIPEKSRDAYKNFNFRPYKIKLWELSSALAIKKDRKEIIAIGNYEETPSRARVVA